MKALKSVFRDQRNKTVNLTMGKSSDIAYKLYSPKGEPKKSENGSIVILLHGLMRGKETWDVCGQHISERTHSKVYSLDARNHGESKWTETMDYESMADDVVEFMDKMAIQKAAIVGHGMGAKTAMVLALKHPERVQSLIVEDTTFKSHSKSREELRRGTQKFRELLDFILPDLDLKRAQRMAVSGMVVRHYYLMIKRRENKPKIWEGCDLPLKKKRGGGFEWNLNLKCIAEKMSVEPWKQTGVFDGPVLVIYGTHSINNVLEE